MRTLFMLLAITICGSALAQSTITASGNELRYRGKRLVLHGVGMGDPLLIRQNRPASDYRSLAKDWNANVVRLAIHPGVWKTQNRDFVVGQIRQQIAQAEANGHFVILTWHVIGWPDAFFQNSANDPDFYDSDFDLAKNYWTRIAQEFGGDGRVIFELWNEPVHEFEIGHPRWWQMKPYYEQLIAIVRQFSGNLVLATGNNYAFDLRSIAADPLADANAAYSWHVYAFGAVDEAYLDIQLAGLDRVAPVLVTEWGFNFSDPAQWPGDAKNFGPAFVEKFLRNRQLHSAAWAWAPGWNPTMLEADFSTPTRYGKFVKEFLAENREVIAKARGRKTAQTIRPKITLRGNAAAPLGVDRVEFKAGKAKWRKARGLQKWRFPFRLKPGRNIAKVRAVDRAGNISPLIKFRVVRARAVDEEGLPSRTSRITFIR